MQQDISLEKIDQKKLFFVFAGQGSQLFHMGKAMFENNICFRSHMISIDNKFINELGYSVIDYMYDEKKRKTDPFDRIEYSHPAIFMIEYAAAKTLIDAGIEPDAVMGASLGELSAAVISGGIDIDAAVYLIARQVRIFSNFHQDGEMMVVFDKFELYENSSVIKRNCEVISKNSDIHFVVGGHKTNLDIVRSELNRIDISFQTLPVRQAFHTKSMDILKPQIDNYVQYLHLSKLEIPIYSCTQGDIVTQLNHDHFWQVIRKEIKVTQTISAAEQLSGNIYVDLSPSGTFANLLKYNLKTDSSATVKAVFSPYGSDDVAFSNVQSLLKERSNAIRRLQRNKIESKGNFENNQYFENRVIGIGAHRQNKQFKKQKSLVYMFPGQGSQFRGMGEELFDQFPSQVEAADRVLGYSLKELCLENPQQKLSKTEYTQPALYVVSILDYLKRLESKKVLPDCVAGHSLGEYCALFAGGAFDFESGLKLVKFRGELMSRARDGGMAAVLGLNSGKIHEIIKIYNLHNIDVANYNSPEQIVLSGSLQELGVAQELFIDAGANYVPLNVSAAFHSRFMKPFADEFSALLRATSFMPLHTPVIANVSARPYGDDEFVKNLSSQLYSPVRWTDSIEHLIDSGRNEFVEVGPGNVLTKLVDWIKKSREPIRRDAMLENV